MTDNHNLKQKTLVLGLTKLLQDKMSSSISYSTEYYIHSPDVLELNKAQCYLMALLHGLVSEDLTTCVMLSSGSAYLRLLRSTYLKIWLRDDFNFPRQDLQKAMVFLENLISTEGVQFPGYVIDVFHAVAAKFNISINRQANYHNCSSYTVVAETDLDDKMQCAVLDNNVGDMLRLFMKGANINKVTEYGDSLLHMAVRSCCLESIAAFGYLKADLDLRDGSMMTPLQRAVLEDNAAIVRALVKAGANTNRRIIRGDTMLHLAAAGCFNEVLEALLDVGTNVQAVNNSGETALLHAVRGNNLTGVKILMRKGADPYSGPNKGKKPIEVAAESDNVELINTLTSGITVIDFSSESVSTSLHQAAMSGNAAVVKALLKAGVPSNLKNSEGLMPLHVTCDVSIVKLFVENGADIDIMSEEGSTALHLASITGKTELATALIYLGAEVDLKDRQGDTALSLATANLKKSIMNILLSEGANPNIANKKGRTSLHQAAKAGSSIDIVKTLLGAGAEVNPLDNNGLTPAHLAAINGQLPLLKLLVQEGANTNSRSNNGNVMLHNASYVGSIDVVSWLLDAGENIEVRGNDGATPLHFAVKGGHVDMVRLLLDRGADVGGRAFEGWTPLHSAADHGNLQVLKLLLERGAHIYARDKSRSTPLSFAIDRNHVSIIKYSGPSL